MFTTITLDKPRCLRYGTKATALVERKLKKPIASIDLNALTVDDLMVIVWAGLAHEDKELTPDKLLDIIDENDIDLIDVVSKMSEAISARYGGNKAENFTEAAPR